MTDRAEPADPSDSGQERYSSHREGNMTDSAMYAKDCQHISELADCHFSVVRWFERMRLIHPNRPYLAAACTIAANHVERKYSKEDTSYRILQQCVESWNDLSAEPAATVPRRVFSQLVKNYRTDARVALYRGTTILLCEFGRVGKFRRGLWVMGLREPELSEIVLEYVLATTK